MKKTGLTQLIIITNFCYLQNQAHLRKPVQQLQLQIQININVRQHSITTLTNRHSSIINPLRILESQLQPMDIKIRRIDADHSNNIIICLLHQGDPINSKII